MPTLNELYRPFRQGNNITEANPNLKTEHATTGEIGADWTPGDFRAGITALGSVLEDAVDAVTVATSAGERAGHRGHYRGRNRAGAVERQPVRADGAQAYAEWILSKSRGCGVTTSWIQTEILAAAVAPSLVGHQLVQVPKNSATLGASWSAPGELVLTPGCGGLARNSTTMRTS